MLENSTHQAEQQVEVRRLNSAHLTLVDAIAKHEAVWPHISNDTSPPMDEFTLADALAFGGNYFLGLYMNDELVGYWMMIAQSSDILEAHTCMLPQARGAPVTKALPVALQYLFTCTPALTLMTHVPYTNPAALKLAKWAGFKQATTHAAAWTRDSITCDVDVLYLTWADWLFARNGSPTANARHLVGTLATHGHHAKSAYFHSHLTSLLGDLTGDK